VRLLGEPQKGTFDEIQVPRFPKHRCYAYIQYNERMRHFRYVRTQRDRMEILDGPNITTITCGDFNTELFKGGWRHYICGYERRERISV
jgi:hypothetical protein